MDYCYLEAGPYKSITDFVNTMNTLIQEKQNQSESCIKAILSRGTQSAESRLAREKSGLAFIRNDLGHLFGSIVGKELKVLLRARRPHKPVLAYEIVHIHSPMIYTGFI